MIDQFIKNEPLSLHTTFGIGGPAQYYYQATTTSDLVKVIKYARKHQIPFIIIGNGSNILVSDKGIKGLVIKNKTENIKILKTKPSVNYRPVTVSPRYQSVNPPSTSPLKNLEYQQNDYQSVLVSLDSGVFMPKAIFSLINKGITGLEWFSGIPTTIGGAVFINIHGGHKFLSDYLYQAKILTLDNKIKIVKAKYFQYDYDYSKLKKSHDIVLTATLRLFKGPKDKAFKIAKDWAFKKSNQPQKSAGCIFQNLNSNQQQQLDLPTNSTGYLIDKILNLKGKQIGQARISEKHAGFIENIGNAKAEDVYSLIKVVQSNAKQKHNLDLKLEIIPLGFK